MRAQLKQKQLKRNLNELWAVSCERCKLSAASGKLQVVHLHLHLQLHLYLDVQVTLRAAPGQLVGNFTLKLLKKLSQRLRAKQLSAQLWGNCSDYSDSDAIKRSTTRPAAVECKWVAVCSSPRLFVRRKSLLALTCSCFLLPLSPNSDSYSCSDSAFVWCLAPALPGIYLFLCCVPFYFLFILIFIFLLSQLLLLFLLMRNCW